MGNRIVFLAVAIGLALSAFVCADDNVREVQTKLHDEGLYSGEIDGAYSSDLSAALTRYQVRKGLPITGQLDTETSEALGAKPAVGPSTAATEQGSETWRRLRNGERRASARARRSETAATEAQEMSSPGADETSSSTASRPRSAPRGYGANLDRNQGAGVSAAGHSANLDRDYRAGIGATGYIRGYWFCRARVQC